MRFLCFVFMCFFSISLLAQTTFDALRYSTLDVEATARNTSVGGGMSGIGADFTSLSTNPAGLAAFRFSEWTFSPAVFSTNAKSEYVNASTPTEEKTRKNRFIFPGFGAVSVRTIEQGRWRNFNFGIGYVQTSHFSQEFNFAGEARGSIVDRFLDQLNDSGFNDFESGIAFDAGAIYENSGIYTSDTELNPAAQIRRSQNVLRSGSQGEVVAGLAGNLDERFLIGLSVGFPVINYSEEKRYQERDNASNIPFYENLEFQENVSTTGAGINAKLGIVFMPTYQLRFGAAVHTPSSYSLEDVFNNTFSYTYTDNGELISSLQESPDGLFNYRLTTPWRYIANAGYVIGRLGFVTGEVEYVNQSKSRFRSTSSDASSDDAIYLDGISADISNQFQSTINARVGAEIAWGVLRFRGGVGLGTSPYVDEKAWNRKIGAGIGYRKNRFFMDFAYRYAQVEESYTPYLVAGDTQPNIQNQFNNQRFILTFGFKQD